MANNHYVLNHLRTLIMAPWRFKSPITRLFSQRLVLAYNKANTEALNNAYLNSGFPSQKASYVESVSISCRYHVMAIFGCIYNLHPIWLIQRWIIEHCLPEIIIFDIHINLHRWLDSVILSYLFHCNAKQHIFCLARRVIDYERQAGSDYITLKLKNHNTILFFNEYRICYTQETCLFGIYFKWYMSVALTNLTISKILKSTRLHDILM